MNDQLTILGRLIGKLHNLRVLTVMDLTDILGLSLDEVLLVLDGDDETFEQYLHDKWPEA